MVGNNFDEPYGLFDRWFPRNKQWAVRVDYLRKLSKSDEQWLDRFNREFHAGSVKKGDPDALHKTDEHRKDCYQRNNLQNRDLYGIAHCVNRLTELTDFQFTPQKEPEQIKKNLAESLIFQFASLLSSFLADSSKVSTSAHIEFSTALK